MSISVRQADTTDLDWVNQCYAAIDFTPSHSGELIVIASHNGQAAGLGRVVPLENGQGELGGIYVLDDFRGLGIASVVVDSLLQQAADTPLYCLPFAKLAEFYMGKGFAPLPADHNVPAVIENKHAWCNQHYAEPVLLLYRPAQHHASQ